MIDMDLTVVTHNIKCILKFNKATSHKEQNHGSFNETPMVIG